MKNSFLKNIATCYKQVMMMAIVCFAGLSFQAKAQIIRYPDAIDTASANSNSRMIVNVVEMGDSIKLEILGLGYLNTRTYQVTIAYDSMKLMLMDTLFINPIPTGSIPAMSAMVQVSPALPAGYYAANLAVGASPYNNVRYAMAGVSTSRAAYVAGSLASGYSGNIWRVMPGTVEKAFTLFLKKKVSGASITPSDLGFYLGDLPVYEPTITGAEATSVGYRWGSGIAWTGTELVELFNDTLFVFRWTSTVTTNAVSELAKTSATLNGAFTRGKFNPGVDEISTIYNPLRPTPPSLVQPNTDLDWDAISRCGFIWSDSDAVITTDPFEKTVNIDGTPYTITAADYAAGYFTIGLKTFWIKAKSNANANPTVAFNEGITGLTQDQEYFGWAFMYYSFQTSDTFFAVGEKINFTPFDCAPPAPTGDGEQDFCNAATVAELEATPDNPADAIKWYQNGVLLASTDNLSTGTYYAKAESFDYGCISEDSLEVVVTIVIPAVSINLSDKDTTVCSTTSVTFDLTAMVTAGSGTDSIEFNEAIDFGSATSISLVEAAAYTVATNTTQKVYVRGYNRDLDCHSTAVDTITIQVNTASDNDKIALVSGDDTVCYNTSATLTVGAANGTTLTDPTFRWYASDTATAPFYTGATYTSSLLLADTTFWVSVESDEYCEGAADATGRKQIDVTVLPLSTASMIDVSGDDTVCYNTSATLTASVANGTTINNPTFYWYASNSATTPFYTGATYITSNLIADTTFWVSVEGDEYCEGVASATGRKQIDVTVLPLATANMITVTGDTSICEGTTTTLTASASTVDNAVFEWYRSAAAATSFYTGNSYTTSTLSTDTIFYVAVKGDNYCENEGSQRKRVRVEVITNVTPAIAITSTETRVCDGMSVTFSVYSVNNEGTDPAYQWKKNGTNVGTGATTYSYNPVNGDTITCVLTSSVECVTQATATSNKIIMTVDTLPNAPRLLTGKDTLLANPFELVDLGTAVDSIPGMIYTYYENANKTGLIAGSEVIFDPDLKDDYYVTVTDGNSCESAAKRIIIKIRCLATLPIADARQEFCTESTVGDLVAYIKNGERLAWFQNGEELQMTDILQNGVYYAKTEDIANSCFTRDSLTVIVIIHPEPEMHISGDTVMCVGGTIRLIGNYTGGNWYSDDPMVATIDNDGYVSGIDEGMVTITYTYKHVTNCIYTLTHDVEVIAAPQRSDIISAETGTICQGDTLFLEAVAEEGYIPVWYSDANLTNQVGIGTRVPVAGLSAGTHTYYVAAKDLLTGCVAPIAETDSVTGTVNPAPNMIVTNPYTLYGNGTVSLYNMIVNPNPVLYNYTFWDEDLFAFTTPVQSLTLGQYDNFAAIATDKTTGCILMKLLQITVVDLGDIVEFIQVISDPICMNETTTASIIITNNDILPQYNLAISSVFGSDLELVGVQTATGSTFNTISNTWEIPVLGVGDTMEVKFTVKAIGTTNTDIEASLVYINGMMININAPRPTAMVNILVHALPQISASPMGAYTEIGLTTTVNMSDNNLLHNKTAVILDTTIASINSYYDGNDLVIDVTGKKQGNTEIIYTSINDEGCEATFIIPVQIGGLPTAILWGKDIVKCNVPGGGDTAIVQIAYIMGGTAPWTVTISDDGGTFSMDTTINAKSDLPVWVAVTIPENMGRVPEFTSYRITNVIDDLEASKQTHYGEVRIGTNPTPRIDTIANQIQTVCAGQPTLPVSFAGVATVYTWSIDNNIGSVNYANGVIPSFIAENAGTTPVTAMIVITPEYWYNGVVCMGMPDTAYITVNPVPVVNPVADVTVCSGSPIAINFGGGADDYNWTFVSGTNVLPNTSGVGDISETYANASSVAAVGRYSVLPVYTSNNGGCNGIAQMFTITVLPVPTVNPVANQQLCHNETTTEVAFSGKVSGTVYRWTNSDATIGLAAWGAGNILPFRALNNGSSAKTATIVATPEYTMNGETCFGRDTQFTIVVDAIPSLDFFFDSTYCNAQQVKLPSLTSNYLWRATGDNIGLNNTNGMGTIIGFTASNNTTSPKMAAFEVTPLSGTCAGRTLNFNVTVLPDAQLTVNPVSNQQLCHGETTHEVVFSGDVPNASYRWTNDSAVIGLAASGLGNILQFKAFNNSLAPHVATIRIVPEYTLNGITCANANAAIDFTITVDAIPGLPNIFDSTYCAGSTIAAITLQSSYTWRQTGDNVGLVTASGSGTIPQFTATNATTSPKTAVFEITPLTENCTGQAIMYSVTVLPGAAMTLNPIADQQLCHGETTTEVAFSGSASGAVYRWTNNDATIGLAASGAGNILPFKALNDNFLPTAKTATITVTPSYTMNGVTCSNANEIRTFTITVDAVPVAPIITNAVYCDGDMVDSIPLRFPNVTYTWKMSGDNIGLATFSSSGTIPRFTATNNGTRPLTATFEIIPVSGNCQGETVRFNITVNPRLEMISDKDMGEMCSDMPFKYTARSNVSNVAFNWSRAAIAGINEGAAAKGTGAVIDEMLYNRTADPVTVTYIIELSYEGCINDTNTVTVVVNPIPVLTVAAVVDVCEGAATATLECRLDESQEGLDVLYNIVFDVNALLAGFVNMNGILTGDEITIDLPDFLPQGNYGGTLKVAASNGCINSTTYRFYIQVNENTRITKQPESVILCEDDAFTLSVTATGKQLTYQWYHNGSLIRGATSSTYSVAMSDSSDYGNYYVIVEGLCGNATSNTVEVGANGLTLLTKWTDVIFISNANWEFVSYQWYKNGKPIGKDGNYQSYLEDGGLDGTYYVVATSADGTKHTSCPLTIQKPASDTRTVSVYPNPMQPFSEITIDMQNYPLGEVEGSKLEIIDMLGQYVTETTLNTPYQKVYLHVNKGVYMYRITTKTDEVIVGKIIVH